MGTVTDSAVSRFNSSCRTAASVYLDRGKMRRLAQMRVGKGERREIEKDIGMYSVLSSLC